MNLSQQTLRNSSDSQLNTVQNSGAHENNAKYWQSIADASQGVLAQKSFAEFTQWVVDELLEQLNCIRIQVKQFETAGQFSNFIDAFAPLVIPESIQDHRYPSQNVALTLGDRTWGEIIASFSPDTAPSASTQSYLEQMGLQLMLAYQQELRETSHAQEKASQTALNQQLKILNQQLQDNLIQNQHCSIQNTHLSGQLDQLNQTRVELERQNLRSSIISSLNRKILKSPELDEVLNITVQETRKFLQADRVLIYQIFPDGSGKITHESCNEKFRSTLGFAFKEETLPLECQARLVAIPYRAVNNARQAYPDHPCMVEFMEQWNIRSKVVVPIALKQRAWGFLIVHQCEHEHEWSSTELSLLSDIRDLLELSLSQSRLYGLLHKELKLKKQAEIQLKQSLIEKEGLLRDTHHRVKNNLNLISSILNLQAGYSEDETLINVLHDSQFRIFSIALIYEQLYQSHNSKQLQIRQYVNALIQHTRDFISVDTDHITVDIQVPDVLFDLDTALPCGLIINELLTNCFKYAFPECSPGQVNITLEKTNQLNTLTIEDNGVGLPSANWEDSPSLGLRLVKLLAQQLDSELQYLPTPRGTCFQVTFAEISPIVQGRTAAHV